MNCIHLHASGNNRIYTHRLNKNKAFKIILQLTPYKNPRISLTQKAVFPCFESQLAYGNQYSDAYMSPDDIPLSSYKRVEKCILPL